MSEFSDMFLEKDENKLLVELTLEGDREEQVRLIYTLLQTQSELIPGVKVKQIFFMGYDKDKIVHQKKVELVEHIKNEVEALLSELDDK